MRFFLEEDTSLKLNNERGDLMVLCPNSCYYYFLNINYKSISNVSFNIYVYI